MAEKLEFSAEFLTKGHREIGIVVEVLRDSDSIGAIWRVDGNLMFETYEMVTRDELRQIADELERLNSLTAGKEEQNG